MSFSIIAEEDDSLSQRRGAEFAILCPIPEEWNSACQKLESLSTPPDQTLPTRVGFVRGVRVVCVNSGKGEGVTAASLQSVLVAWRPRWVLLVGIAGGFIEQGVNRGDVVIARYVYNFDFGKLTSGKFIRRPDCDFPCDRKLLSYAELVIRASGSPWKRFIQAERPDNKGNEATRAIDGYIASSAKVVDDPDHNFFDEVRQTIRDAEIHAVEMEACGAAAAISLEQSERSVGFLMVRGISDLPTRDADPNSGTEQRNKWKLYAADAAAAFVYQLITVVAESNCQYGSAVQQGAYGSESVPASPEEVVQSLKAELFRPIKYKKSAKGRTSIPCMLAVLHGEHFPKLYLDRLLFLLNESAICWKCPSLDRKAYSYSVEVDRVLQDCTHILFLAQSHRELTFGWGAYLSTLSIDKQKPWIPRLIKI